MLRLPFGRGEHFGSEWNAATDAILGGWQLSTTYQYQSGAPLLWGSSIYYDASCGDPKNLKSYIGEKVDGGIGGLDVPGWDTSCFYFNDAPVQVDGVVSPALQRADTRIELGNNVRYFPSTLPNVRTDDLHLLDLGISNNFALPRGTRLQVRLRGDQRDQLHRPVESAARSAECQLRIDQPGPQQPARLADRPQIYLLGSRSRWSCAPRTEGPPASRSSARGRRLVPTNQPPRDNYQLPRTDRPRLTAAATL